jgi:ectoine hydroxylase-related dioxygenase (phytanoyl-CoA dioxygenase family)
MLTQREIDIFFSEGLIITTLDINHEILNKIVRDTEYGCKKQNANLKSHGTRIQDLWVDSENIKRVALLPQLMIILEQLYKRKPLPFQTINFYLGTQQKLHADTLHFNSIPKNNMCGVWVALEDIDENNGPINYCPGSHKLPEITMKEVGKGIGHDNYRYYEEYIEEFVKDNNLPIKKAIIKKGQAIIWHGNLLHGGSHHKNRQKTRLSMVTHYFFEGCQYYTPIFSTSENIHYRDPEWIELVAVDKLISKFENKYFQIKKALKNHY